MWGKCQIFLIMLATFPPLINFKRKYTIFLYIMPTFYYCSGRVIWSWSWTSVAWSLLSQNIQGMKLHVLMTCGCITLFCYCLKKINWKSWLNFQFQLWSCPLCLSVFACALLTITKLIFVEFFLHFPALFLCRSSLPMKRLKTLMINTGHYEQRR